MSPFALAIGLLGVLAPIAAQTDNLCDAGEAPDIVVGEIVGVRYYGVVGEIAAFAFGTDSCNLGTCEADWIADSSRHPVIAQNLFRLQDGRFEQIGQSWLKHGFATIPETTCSEDCLPSADDEHLGVNCSDLYSAGLNGFQSGMGPKSEVRALTGLFSWPPTDYGVSGDPIYKRLQVHVDDLDPALYPGAQYFVEAQYVTRDDAAAGHQDNNASFRSAQVEPLPGGDFTLSLTGSTQRTMPAIFAWSATDPAVRITPLDWFGRYYVGARVTDLGNGTWRYEYAIENLNADGAAGFSVPVNGGSSVTNLGFHDVEYHSGEPYDGTDWPAVFDRDAGKVSWNVTVLDEHANALRWGTLYNFRFDCDSPPVTGSAVVRPFFVEASVEAAVPGSVQTWVPRACDGDGICDPAEDCNNCPGDCAGGGSSGFCGDGICDPTGGEDCVSCDQDCNGQQSGTPSARFCCGDGDGQNPADCTDPRCSASGFDCASPCCGDGVCNFGEDPCGCAPDCGAPAPAELACQNALDDDCDGSVDCVDLDCCLDPVCADGTDADGDSVTDCDCDDTNAAVWARPGEAEDVRFAHDAVSGSSLLSWTAPVDPGGTVVSYAVLRSGIASDFVAGADCLVLADPLATSATDTDSPSSGKVSHYLVRAENACPAGEGVGPLGTGADGMPRPGRGCP